MNVSFIEDLNTKNNVPTFSPSQDTLYDSDPSRYLKMNCIDIANHLHYCPVCSKYYKRDKIWMIAIIVILSVVILIMLKKCV